MKRLTGKLLSVLILLSLLAGSGLSEVRSQTPVRGEVVSAELQSALNEQGPIDIVIQFKGKADYSRAQAAPNWSERGEAVLQQLFANAERSQSGVVRLLATRGVEYESFPINNVLAVRGATKELVDALSKDPEVLAIRTPIKVELDELSAVPAAGLNQQTWPAGPTEGVNLVRAPLFWQAFSMGQGVVVATIDSGVDVTHPALAGNYNCLPADPVDKCWHDVTQYPSATPFDGVGHGTHVTGIMVGNEPSAIAPQVGVAPGAKWIACRAFGSGTTDEILLYRCGSWLLAPNNDPANRPNIVNNSWSEEAGSTVPYDWYSEMVAAWRATGILPVFSAGNKRTLEEQSSTCVLMLTPSSYPNVFTVGAVDMTKILWVNSKTGSDGAGTFTQTLKPDLAAPGVEILSSLPGGAYGTRTGTSMAAPFGAGSAALLMSCSLGNKGEIAWIEQMLRNGAAATPDGLCGVDPGGDGNYSYGHGTLDVYMSGLMFCDSMIRYYFPIIYGY